MLKKMYLKVWSTVDYFRGKALINDDSEIVSHRNLPYGNNILRFDIHFPKNMEGRLPTIFNIHGGGYVTGYKDGNNRFCQELAKRGFVVFNVEYTPSGMDNKYFPTPIHEFFKFYKFMTEETDLGTIIDFNNVFMCGNSSGGHIASLISTIQSHPILKQEFNLQGGPPVKGSILICPTFGVYNFNGMFLKKHFHDVVFGPLCDRDPLAEELTHGLKVTTDSFPPSIMFSVKGDVIVGAHKKPFLKLAKELDLSVQHYQVTSGYELFHCSMVRYSKEYPKCMDLIAQFVNDAKENKFVSGVVQRYLKEDTIKPTEQLYERVR